MSGQQLLITVAQFKELTGLSNTKVFELLKSGAIERRKIGRATRITRESAEKWIQNLPRTSVEGAR